MCVHKSLTYVSFKATKISGNTYLAVGEASLHVFLYKAEQINDKETHRPLLPEGQLVISGSCLQKNSPSFVFYLRVFYSLILYIIL